MGGEGVLYSRQELGQEGRRAPSPFASIPMPWDLVSPPGVGWQTGLMQQLVGRRWLGRNLAPLPYGGWKGWKRPCQPLRIQTEVSAVYIQAGGRGFLCPGRKGEVQWHCHASHAGHAGHACAQGLATPWRGR